MSKLPSISTNTTPAMNDIKIATSPAISSANASDLSFTGNVLASLLEKAEAEKAAGLAASPANLNASTAVPNVTGNVLAALLEKAEAEKAAGLAASPANSNASTSVPNFTGNVLAALLEKAEAEKAAAQKADSAAVSQVLKDPSYDYLNFIQINGQGLADLLRKDAEASDQRAMAARNRGEHDLANALQENARNMLRESSRIAKDPSFSGALSTENAKQIMDRLNREADRIQHQIQKNK